MSTLITLSIGSTSRPGGSKKYTVVHPETQKAVHEVEAASESDVEAAIAAAHKSVSAWSTKSLDDRAAILRTAAELIRDTQSGWGDRLVRANRAETSVTEWWARQQIQMAPAFLDELADAVFVAMARETVSSDHGTIHIDREPYGVCLSMAPWNAAQLLTSRAICTPLIAGNTVILKTSEKVPLTQLLWAELLYAAGVPRECLVVLHVAPEDSPLLVQKLVADHRVRHVNFTGSTRVGSIIAGLAGQSLKPSLMELGGKAPVLVLPDADIQVAASHIIFGAFMNAGQVCMSTERIIVPVSRHGELVQALQKTWAAVKRKQPRHLFSSASTEHVQSLMDDATRKGAISLFESKASSTAIIPTIFSGGQETMKILEVETFGPVAIIISVPDKGDEAEDVIETMVQQANSTEYGLTAAVWGQDLKLAQKVARRLDCGAVHINGSSIGDHPNVPHGGWKSSGWGRFNSVEGIRSFSQTRSIEVQQHPLPLPLDIFEL